MPRDDNQQQQVLRESEERLRLATEAARMFVWDCDFAAQTIRWSDNAAALLGCRPEDLPNDPRESHFFVVPEDSARIWREYEEAVARRLETYTTELRGRGPEGTQRSYLAQCRVEYDRQGVPVRAIGVTQDITERKQAEEALRESDAILRAFYDNSPVFMGVTEPTGDGDVLHLYDNPATCRFFGVEPGTTSSRRALADLGADPRVVERWLRGYEASVATGQPIHFEHQFPSPDSPRWLAVTVCPIGPGPSGRTRFCYVAEDVTERKNTEAALSETAASLVRERERLAVALRAGQLGVYEWRVGAPTVWWSQEVYPVYGVQSESFTPTPEAFSALIHPEDREETWRKTEEAIARREMFIHEYRIVRPDGEVRWIANQSMIGLDAEGQVERITGVAMDITERKQAEQTLREADRQKDEFLATLSHELRNPLAPIRNALSVLRAKGSADPEVVWAQDVIERQLRQMGHLLDDLLDVSRITRGKVELRKSRVTLASIVENAVETSRPLIDGGGHELTVTLPSEPVTLEADPVRLAQVFSNLLNNAAKYTPNGGRIQLTAERQGSQVAVSVRDNGIGIPSDMLPRVFEMFSQAEPARERWRGGLGIGLSLARGLVELHGGSIEGRSGGPGMGSDFIVRLPAFAEEPDTEAPRPGGEGAEAQPGMRRLLIVDDLKDSADSMAMFLQMMGYETHTAYDGEEALAAAERLRPDVILLDLGMPKMNGYDTCRHIRQQPWGQRMFIVALTGWGQEDDRRRTRGAGFDDHLVKPVDSEALMRLLASLLEKPL